MSVNIDKLRKAREESASKNRGAGWLNFPNGETLVYLGGPCREEDEVPFVEVLVHYSVGPNNKMTICLDNERNHILNDKRVRSLLDEKYEGKGVALGRCPACQECEKLEKTNKEASGRIRRTSRYLWNMIFKGFREKMTGEWDEAKVTGDVQTAMIGTKIWEGMLDVFLSEGDIANQDAAILVRVFRSGKGLRTEYKVNADSASLRKPIRLTKSERASLEKGVTVGGDNDLYRLVSEMTKSPDDVEALLAGVDLAKDKDEDTPPNCFERSYENDEECKVCAWRILCTESLGVKLHKGHEPDKSVKGYDDWRARQKKPKAVEEDEDEAPAKPSKKTAPPEVKPSKKAAPPKDEEEDDEEVEDDDSEEVADDESEEVEADEPEEVEEEAAPPPKAVKKAAKPAPVEDDAEPNDDGLDALERALAKRSRKSA